MEFDELSRRVIGCAIEVHRNLGPGCSNRHIVNVSHASCRMRAFHFKWRYRCPSATKMSCSIAGYRIDLLVRSDLIVEIKSVETLLPIHQAQILTYMRLARIPIGLLMNFNVTKLQNGIKRFVL